MQKALSSVLLALCLVLGTPALADRAGDLDRLYDALGMPEVLEIMREEGVEHATGIRDELFPGDAGEAWPATAELIYDLSMMDATLRMALDEGLDDADLDPLLTFFTSERGERIIGFEISARRAMMDEGIEEAATERYRKMRAEDDPRLGLIDAFVEVNDLVEANVMGAMNSNYAYYLGLIDGAAYQGGLTESEVLDDVWSQEEAIREDTMDWLHAYLTMAYQPLEDADIEAYLDLSRTGAGRALNSALFDGFDRMYVAISRALGLAAARHMAGQDI